MKFAAPISCVVRGVSAHLSQCVRASSEEIDVDMARLQHRSYVSLLKEFVPQVIELQSDRSLPDCCFIEDIAVVLEHNAVITRPGAAPRRPECQVVSEYLAHQYQLHTMQEPACLDGGDVLQVGQQLWVGLSKRTNAKGIAFLEQVAQRENLTVHTVPIAAGLHLKSACTMLDSTTIIYDPQLIEPKDCPANNLRWIASQETLGANVLALGDTIIVSANAPHTRELLHTAGYTTHIVSISELHKADGALTCLSLRITSQDNWCP